MMLYTPTAAQAVWPIPGTSMHQCTDRGDQVGDGDCCPTMQAMQ